MTEVEMICRLCEKPKSLQRSHVIPRSYYKRLKRCGGGQLVSISYAEQTGPKKSNSNPTEELLCSSCEQFLDREYEKYGTRALINPKRTTIFHDYISVKKFEYQKAFLYFSSILWRASISTLPDFQSVRLTPKLNEVLRHCIKNKSLKVNKNIRLSDYLKISVLRVVDRENILEDEIIKNTLMTFGVEPGSEESATILYYFMVDGFLICYLFYGRGLESSTSGVVSGVLENKNRIRIPKVEVTDLKQIHDAFAYISNLPKISG